MADNDTSIVNNNTMENMERQTVENYQSYMNTLQTQLTTMWNFVLYSQFNNEEIRKLYREIRFLKMDNNMFKEKNEKYKKDLDKLTDERDDLDDKLFTTEMKLKHLKEKDTKKRKRDESNVSKIKIRLKRPRNYVSLNPEEMKKRLSKIFNNLDSIEDIIKLETLEHKFDFMKNKKFNALYCLIKSLKEFDKIIGMKSVKEEMFKMISFFIHKLNSEEELNHIVITGPPGVGKTTLAKVLGNIYLSMGFLNNNKFILAKRSDLIGKYCGHTAKQTQEMIDKAEGGVLFIDEVYSLGNKDKKDTFTKECIDTINQNLTENSNKFLCIIAGYKDDVDTCFFNYNKGLRRRFNLNFKIEGYSKKDLFKIYNKFVMDENFKLDDNINIDILGDEKLYKYYGGDMRTLFQYSKENYSLRLLKTSLEVEGNEKKIIKEDIVEAIEKLKRIREQNNEMPYYIKALYC